MRDYREISLWRDISEETWKDWHWQFSNTVTSIEQLRQIIHLSDEEKRGIEDATCHLKMKISPHLATLMNEDDPSDPLRRQFVPSGRELASIDDEKLFADVNADDRFSPVSGLIHRYPSKVLIFPSNYCGAYCRYCFRRKLVRDREEALNKKDYEAIFDYLHKNPEVEEVIFSGGDPLVIGDEMLDFILGSLSKIPHIQLVRLHTRLPITIPYRITSDFISMLTQYKKYFPIFVVLHTDCTLNS